MKIAASLIDVGAAMICVRLVFQRRQIEDVNVLLEFGRRIMTMATIAVVFAAPTL